VFVCWKSGFCPVFFGNFSGGISKMHGGFSVDSDGGDPVFFRRIRAGGIGRIFAVSFQKDFHVGKGKGFPQRGSSFAKREKTVPRFLCFVENRFQGKYFPSCLSFLCFLYRFQPVFFKIRDIFHKVIHTVLKTGDGMWEREMCQYADPSPRGSLACRGMHFCLWQKTGNTRKLIR